MKSCVLLYCAHPTAAHPYVEIAKALAEQFEIRPVLLVRSEDVSAHRALAQHRLSELPVHTLSGVIPALGPGQRLLGRLNRMVGHIPISQIRMLSTLVYRIEDCRARSLKMLESLTPVLAVVPDDRRPSVTLPFLDACRRRQVPVLLHSGALLSSPYNIQTRRMARPGMVLRGWRSVTARWLPTGARAVGDHTVVFFDLVTALAIGLCGLKVRNPWIMGGSGYVDHLATQGEAERSEILADPGWKPAAVSVIGHPSLDGLDLDAPASDSGAAGLVAEGRPLAIFAVPQQFSDAPNFAVMELRNTVEALTNAGFGVLLSLHPKSRREDFEALLRCGGPVDFADGPLAHILHLADLFIASYSSTISWAGSLGIASAVIDFHEENSPLYKEVAAVPVLRAPSEVAEWGRSMADLHRRKHAGHAMKAAFEDRFKINGNAARDLAALCADLGGFRSKQTASPATS